MVHYCTECSRSVLIHIPPLQNEQVISLSYDHAKRSVNIAKILRCLRPLHEVFVCQMYPALKCLEKS